MARRGMSGVTSVTGRATARSATPGNWPVLAVLVAVSLIVAGCGRSQADGKPSPVPVATLTVPTASPSVASGDDLARRAVLAQYSAFWRALPVASAAGDERGRFAALFPMTTDPELAQLVKTLGEQRRRGQVLYGLNHPRAEVLSITGGVAKIRDCQESSSAGLRDSQSGRRITVGVSRHPVESTLLKRGDVWKVARVRYLPKGSQC